MIKFKKTQNSGWGQLGRQLREQLRVQLRGQLWEQLRGQLSGQLRELKPTEEQQDKAWELLKETE